MFNKSNPTVATMGIDIGKNSFHVVGLDQRGAIVLRQKWSRRQIEARLANIPPHSHQKIDKYLLRRTAGPYIWVILRKARDENMFSGMLPIAVGSGCNAGIYVQRHKRTSERSPIVFENERLSRSQGLLNFGRVLPSHARTFFQTLQQAAPITYHWV
jgi:hypothetical protein